MKRNVRKKTMAVVAAAMAMITVMACSNSNASGSKAPSQASDVEVAVKRNDIIIATESEPPTLHPFDHKSVSSSFMNDLTYNTLFIPNRANLSPVPSLVADYENISETQWRFTIHEGVVFHDGSEMGAEDVVASMEYAKTFPTAKDYTSFWSDLEMVDELSFMVTTAGPYAGILDDMCSIKVLPSELIENDHDFNASPIGSGPYKLVKQTYGDKIEFTMNDNYFDKENAPTIKDMTWKIIPEGSSRTIAIEAGEVDMVIEVETTDTTRLEENENIDVVKVAGTRHNFFTLNTEMAPFDNLDFRKAINAAIDREAVVMVAVNGEGAESIAQAPPCFAGFTDENAEGYDLEKAKAYLEASGIDPSTVKFDCIASNDANRRTAEVIQASLKEIGIEMNIVSMDYATYLNAIMGGGYEGAIAGFTASNFGYYLNGLHHSQSINAANISRLNMSDIDQLIETAKTQLNPEERTATYEEIVSLLNERTPYIPLYDSTVTRAYNNKLGGVAVDPAGKMRYNEIYWED